MVQVFFDFEDPPKIIIFPALQFCLKMQKNANYAKTAGFKLGNIQIRIQHCQIDDQNQLQKLGHRHFEKVKRFGATGHGLNDTKPTV